MADVCCEYSIAGLTLNNDTGDTLMLGGDGAQGLDGAPVRSQVDPKGITSGGIVHTKFYGPRIITFSGEVLIRSTTVEDTTAYVTAINVLEAATVSALQGILNTPSNLTWTPTGGSGHTISVTYGVPGQEIQFTGNMLPGERTFSFSLIAADPTIT
jgi:hypothetical protein